MTSKTADRPARDLVVVLGDQLTPTLAALAAAQRQDAVVLMAEVGDEAGYAWHHKKKLVLVFSAMRHFAAELRKAGWRVDYVKLDTPENTGSLTGEIARAAAFHEPARIHVTEPGEWRVSRLIDDWERAAGCPVVRHEDDRFLCSRADFTGWIGGRKAPRMEQFYRWMRTRTGLLLDAGGGPVGGKWNFDADNRKPADADLFMPAHSGFKPDSVTRDVIDLVARKFGDNPGQLEPFAFAVTRRQAERARDRFIADALPRFGDFQDAMLAGEPWLYHSVLSPYLNLGLLDPLDLCQRAEAAFHDGAVPLNCAEGFIRQILGWREYVRGIYWHAMPDYLERNALDAHRDLPSFYWSGETDMACMKAAIGQTLDEAYAHHIQRLMITGNFAMLAGIEPKQVHEWYLAVYADAYEWVELPNTLGMSQFGDGGLLGSKPYAASANYINKMSDYCGACPYDHTRRHGEKACPFNTLYWDFIDRNGKLLRSNPRMRQVYALWDRFDTGEQNAVRQAARDYLDGLR